MTPIQHYECGWCHAPLGGFHPVTCKVAKGSVLRWQCSVVEAVRADAFRDVVEALRFYADPASWDTISERGTVTTETLAVRDGGDRAQRALGRQS